MLLPQSLVYTLLLCLPSFTESRPVPQHQQRSLSNKFANRNLNRQRRAVRDLSSQQRNAIRAPPPSTYTTAPVVWTSVSAIAPPATFIFLSATDSITSSSITTTATTTTSPTSSTTSSAVLPTLLASVSMQVIAIPAPQLITYNYVAPTRSTTIVFATSTSSTSESDDNTPTATSTTAYVKVGSSIYSISSTIIAFEPNFAILSTVAVAPASTSTPTASATSAIIIGTKTFSVASQVAVGPHFSATVSAPSTTSTSLSPAEQLQKAASATSDDDSVLATLASSAISTTTSTGSSIAPTSIAAVHTGALTYYVPSNNLTACNLSSPPTTSFVLSSSLFNTFPNATSNPNVSPLCGKSVEITFGAQTVVGTVGDSCDDCGMWDVGISKALFDSSAGGHAEVEWSFIGA